MEAWDLKHSNKNTNMGFSWKLAAECNSYVEG